MNDALEKTASALAIVEKKPQTRPGGCVGVFFQLFDWNRRFAKKKLFSKKLLSPVRLKSASKKFGGDDKQPKHRLIADENSGGFPNSKKSNVDSETKHEMRPPSLVARLMGLESMPALQRQKSKNVQSSGFGSNKPEKYGDCVREYVKEDWDVVKRGTKLELRPQKLQKTSLSERRSMTRFGTEALPFKNVLSKSRKNHQKLPSPVKSPRNLSRKNASKLMGAATKILEPGLQRTRSKSALTYTNSRHLPQRNIGSEEILHLEPSKLNNHEDSANVVLGREVSCRNCRHPVDNFDSKTRISEHPSNFDSPFSLYGGPACDGSERCYPRQPAFFQESEEEMNMNICSRAKLTSDRTLRAQMQPQKDVLSSFIPNRQTQSQNQILRARHTIPTRTKPNSFPSDRISTVNVVVHERKNHILPNESSSHNTRTQAPARIDNGKFEMERRIASRSNHWGQGQKRTPVNVSRQTKSPVLMNSFVKKQTYGITPLVSAKEQGCKGNSWLQQKTVGSSHVNGNVPLTFQSRVQRKNGIDSVEKSSSQNDSNHGMTSLRPSSYENDGRTEFDNPCPLTGDALSELLEQKLKELSCQGEDGSSNAPKKTTAVILRELISALTQQKKSATSSDAKADFYDTSHLSPLTYFNVSQATANAMTIKTPVDQSLEGEHLSPGSVLDAYFSNESFLSSSLDDNFGYKMPHESVDCSYNKPYTPKPDSVLLDSATSISNPKCSKELVSNILDNVSETLCCINLGNFGLKGTTVDHVKKVLLNAELVLRGADSCSDPFVQRESPVKHLLLDDLETLISVLSTNPVPLSLERSQMENQLERLALDTIIEYLDLRFGRYQESGAKMSRKLPCCIDGKSLFFEIIEEVQKWGELSRFSDDELVEWEMSRSLRKWTRFDAESYETCMEISRKLLCVLVDEIVVDLGN